VSWGSVIASRFQAADRDYGTTQRQAGRNSIGCSAEGEAEVQSIENAGCGCESDGCWSGTAGSVQTHSQGADAIPGPVQQDHENPAAHQASDNGHQGHAPDFVGVEREQAGSTQADQQRKDGAQGNQKSISRQDKAAELEEMRVHLKEFPISMPQEKQKFAPGRKAIQQGLKPILF
jgi:hypothetical protein